MNEPSWQDPAIAKLGASLVGSLVSLRFVVGTWPERFLMFVGGAALSYYSTESVARWIGGGIDTVGLVGFFLGLLGMTIMSKVYEAIQALDSKQLAADFRNWAARKWGA
jgi:sulfite exporter TauE/SafE